MGDETQRLAVGFVQVASLQGLGQVRIARPLPAHKLLQRRRQAGASPGQAQFTDEPEHGLTVVLSGQVPVQAERLSGHFRCHIGITIPVASDP